MRFPYVTKKQIFQILLGVVLITAALMSAIMFVNAENRKMRPPNVTSSAIGQMPKPGDLTGDWTSDTSKEARFVAEIQANTILIHIHHGDTNIAYYYGTWPTPDQSNVFRSVEIDDPEKPTVFSGTGKDFIWLDGTLTFEYKAPAVSANIKLIREK